MARVRIEAPAGLDRLELAQILVGPSVLLKAEPHHQPGTRTFSRYTALQQLTERTCAAFEAVLKRALADVVEYAERVILLSSLRKAENPDRRLFAPLLTPVQLEAVRRILQDRVHGFMVATINPSVLPQAEVLRLVAEGYIPPDMRFVYVAGAGEQAPPATDWIGASYRYGKALGSVRAGDDADYVKKLTFDRFAAHEEKRPRPLSLAETAALDFAKHSAAVHCRGLGNEIADDFSTIAIEADRGLRRKYENEIRDETAANIERRETWRKLASELGHRTGDWARNFGRIAATEKQRAFQEGFSTALKDREKLPAKEIRVAKLPAPDACPDCVRLHLSEGPGSKPRVFSLSQLESHGTNVGKKRNAWQAIVGPTHPYCGCELVHVPDGWGFDDKHRLVPDRLKRSETLEHDLRKAAEKGKHLTYKQIVPEQGIAVRVGDPFMRAEIDKVIARTPEELFDSKVGVTLITTDLASVQNPLDPHDLAYWTGNEIRLMQTLAPERVASVLMHEFGHAINVFLYHKLDESHEAVKTWHRKLFNVSKGEGFVSEYAKREPIENAAEVTRLYLYDRPRLMRDFPRQFAYVRRDYKLILPPWSGFKPRTTDGTPDVR